MQDYTKLKVWEKSHQLTLAIYKHTQRFPDDERFGLTSQLRRCSASIGANIAEGCGRDGRKDMNRFRQIASGSASELSYHLLLAKDLGLLSADSFAALKLEITQTHKMLAGLMATLGEADAQSRSANA
jgi:four helix bundle protein